MVSWVRSRDVRSSLLWDEDAPCAGGKEPMVHHAMAVGISRWWGAVFHPRQQPLSHSGFPCRQHHANRLPGSVLGVSIPTGSTSACLLGRAGNRATSQGGNQVQLVRGQSWSTSVALQGYWEEVSLFGMFFKELLRGSWVTFSFLC